MKDIRYWFAALPFRFALKFSLLYLLKRRLKLPADIFFSQTGEDITLSAIITRFISETLIKQGGFYVDVGCNDPISKSNTFFFYLQGWKGIAIDANEEVINRYKKIRKYDISICSAISNAVKKATLHKSANPFVSTMSNEYYTKNKDRWKYNKTQEVTTNTLTSLLDETLPEGTTIDLLTIDVEGLELEVIQGINFEKYRPKLIVLEAHDFSYEKKEQLPVFQHLANNNYHFHGFTVMNAYFIDYNTLESKILNQSKAMMSTKMSEAILAE